MLLFVSLPPARNAFTFGSLYCLLIQIFSGAFPENYEPPTSNFYYEVNDDSAVVQVKSKSSIAVGPISFCLKMLVKQTYVVFT